MAALQVPRLDVRIRRLNEPSERRGIRGRSRPQNLPAPCNKPAGSGSDAPQNVPGRFGKMRPRIDFEFVYVVRGRRPGFHIEAKRLYRSDSINEYFESGGLVVVQFEINGKCDFDPAKL